MSDYTAPSIDYLQKQLTRAGLSENDSIAGAYWILSVLANRAKSKNTNDDRARIVDLEKALNKAVRLMEQIQHGDSASYRDLASTYEELTRMNAAEAADVGGDIRAALEASRYMKQWRPGGHEEPAHGRIIDDVVHFFRSHDLAEKIHNKSPLVLVIVACTGLDPESALKAIRRRLDSGRSHYHSVEY